MSKSTLDSFVQSSRPSPHPLNTSREINDRKSAFSATIFHARTASEARKATEHLRNVIHASRRATHEISAWRCMVLKPGKTGLGGPEDFEVSAGCEDDGEKWAGQRVLKVMQAEGVMDAVVVVSRWYGGELLGPIRFTHIEDCAREVCQAFVRQEEMEDCISALNTLDDVLASLRAELGALITARPSPSTPGDTLAPPADMGSKKAPDYSAIRESMDVAKAKRLIAARENSIKSVKASLKKKKEQDEKT